MTKEPTIIDMHSTLVEFVDQHICFRELEAFLCKEQPRASIYQDGCRIFCDGTQDGLLVSVAFTAYDKVMDGHAGRMVEYIKYHMTVAGESKSRPHVDVP